MKHGIIAEITQRADGRHSLVLYKKDLRSVKSIEIYSTLDEILEVLGEELLIFKKNKDVS